MLVRSATLFLAWLLPSREERLGLGLLNYTQYSLFCARRFGDQGSRIRLLY